MGMTIISTRATEFTGQPLRQPATTHPDGRVTPQHEVRTLRNAFRETFPGAAIDTSRWDVTQTGVGMTATVTAGTLQIATGTTSGDEFVLTSVQSYTLPLRLNVSVALSQRIANQQFFVEMISVDEDGIEDGLNAAAWRLESTVATNAIYEVQEAGLARLASAASPIATTAAQSLFEIEANSDDCTFHSRVPDSQTARTSSYVRHTQMPDPLATYKLRIRARNTATAASNTTMTVALVGAVEHHEITAEITSGKGSVAASGALAVHLTSATTGTALAIAGTSPVNTATPGNPVMIAGIGVSANPAVVTTARNANLLMTLLGAPVTKPFAIPESDWQFGCTAVVSNTTDLVVKAAAGAAIRNYITGISYQNTNATATEVVIKDGATVVWRGYAAASMSVPAVVTFPTPLKGTANTAVNFANITTAASVYVNAQGFIGP